ncbi:MAG: TetR/AcrR family transcriptional regulator [Chitinophagaceae bacterium]|nr:TetR/AcrR family transcriptional regulator [Chitinophagaceae bacterium]
MTKQKNSRRRGNDLLDSLYNATIKLTDTVKLTNLTFQQIAEEANTSRAVLYRRWTTPFELLQEIYNYKAKELFDGSFFDKLKDNGSLRSDFLQLLTLFQNTYKKIGAEIINNYYFLRTQDSDNSQETEMHKNAVEKYLRTMERILQNAETRGEKIKKVHHVTLMLPFDLIRTENLIRPENINKNRLATMVEEVLLPVFTE